MHQVEELQEDWGHLSRRGLLEHSLSDRLDTMPPGRNCSGLPSTSSTVGLCHSNTRNIDEMSYRMEIETTQILTHRHRHYGEHIRSFVG